MHQVRNSGFLWQCFYDRVECKSEDMDNCYPEKNSNAIHLPDSSVWPPECPIPVQAKNNDQRIHHQSVWGKKISPFPRSLRWESVGRQKDIFPGMKSQQPVVHHAFQFEIRMPTIGHGYTPGGNIFDFGFNF